MVFLFEVLDTAAGVWLDRNGLVTSRSNKVHAEDPSLEVMHRHRHAAASVGVRIYVYGGLRGGKVLIADASNLLLPLPPNLIKTCHQNLDDDNNTSNNCLITAPSFTILGCEFKFFIILYVIFLN